MSEERHSEMGIHLIDPESAGELKRRRQIVRRAGIVTIAMLVLLALGAGRTVFSRMSNAQALEEGASERARQYVKVTLPKASAAGQTLVLPGTLQGFVQSPISARASGYLMRWYKDIGGRRTPCRSRNSMSGAATTRRRAPISPPPTPMSNACVS